MTSPTPLKVSPGSEFLLLMGAIFCMVTVNNEFVNSEPLLLGEIQNEDTVSFCVLSVHNFVTLLLIF